MRALSIFVAFYTLAGCRTEPKFPPGLAFRRDVMVNLNSWHTHSPDAGGSQVELVCAVTVKNRSKEPLTGPGIYGALTKKGQMASSLVSELGACSRCDSEIIGTVPPNASVSGDLHFRMNAKDTPVKVGVGEFTPVAVHRGVEVRPPGTAVNHTLRPAKDRP